MGGGEPGDSLLRCGGLVLDARLSAVLGMLGSGATDEAAARALEVSVRTYRRHVAGIMAMLEVSSRFAAGVRVARLGVLDTRPGGAE
ncbi:response regulator transcription factor [Nonomuraea jiangxiensis]|uniref:Regulatory protein, luxR family n=1 Tax=Nonomuraea jiangxiensis TaxID=633440 RepID=A0A1G8JLM2_9ACTN|nr:response regulator transcription factor [Nonomuraea jiangxiensis]SDI32095.1 regulatory protein, luxR family [Nonomuraea jiangxiensis]